MDEIEKGTRGKGMEGLESVPRGPCLLNAATTVGPGQSWDLHLHFTPMRTWTIDYCPGDVRPGSSIG